MRLKRVQVMWGLAWFAAVVGLLWLGSLLRDLGRTREAEKLRGHAEASAAPGNEVRPHPSSPFSCT